MSKLIKFGNDAREKLKEGVDLVANTVKTTAGPRGLNGVIGKTNGTQVVTNDGHTLAEAIEVSDLYVDAGVKLIKQAAKRTSELSGDGTTTTCILIQAIVDEAMKMISAGNNAMLLRKGLEKASEIVIERLKELSIPVKDNQYLEEVATISANNDKEIGKLIADGFKKVGVDGSILVEKSKTSKDEVKDVKGTEWPTGYNSDYFSILSEGKEDAITFENPYIIMYTGDIKEFTPMQKVIELVVQSGRPLLIVSNSLTGKALDTILANVIQNSLKIVAIEPPSMEKRRIEFLHDLAIMTGGKVIDHELDMKLNQATLEDLGTVGKLKVTRNSTVFVDPAGDRKLVDARVAEIKELNKKDSASPNEIDKNINRIGKLTGKVVKLILGAASETSLEEKWLRCEDALQATKSSLEHGVLPGGGISLIEARKALLEASDVFTTNEEKLGSEILYKALAKPLKQIVKNSGDDGNVVLSKIEEHEGEWTYGFNALTLTYGDLISEGVIDAAINNSSAVEIATDTARMIISSGSLIVNKFEGGE